MPLAFSLSVYYLKILLLYSINSTKFFIFMQMPSHIKLRYSPRNYSDDDACRKKKGKCKEGEYDVGVERVKQTSQENYLATLDIFDG